jgi:hypothetical protein
VLSKSDNNFTFHVAADLQTARMEGPDHASITKASTLMREALVLLDAAGVTLAATHLEQALHLVSEELEVR